MNLFPKTCCFFTVLAFASVLSETVEKYTLNARSGQEIAINCSATPSAQLSTRIWKITTHNINYCLMSFRADKKETFTNCSGHLGWKPGSENSSVLLINPVGIKDDGIYICETTNANGFFFSHITLNVQGIWSSGGLQASLSIWLPIVLCFLIFSFILGFLLYQRPQELRRCYKFTRSQNTSLHREQENTEVEEVEPYASYMQKVNTIYCSVSELAPEWTQS